MPSTATAKWSTCVPWFRMRSRATARWPASALSVGGSRTTLGPTPIREGAPATVPMREGMPDSEGPGAACPSNLSQCPPMRRAAPGGHGWLTPGSSFELPKYVPLVLSRSVTVHVCPSNTMRAWWREAATSFSWMSLPGVRPTLSVRFSPRDTRRLWPPGATMTSAPPSPLAGGAASHSSLPGGLGTTLSSAIRVIKLTYGLAPSAIVGATVIP